ncbi:hypothetical protein [Streptomyces lydicus]|uniref:hypothetical protein n=1 Tax=Streptomyces lydicus TaxID=47763 RepID=UPI003416A46D
MAGLPGLLRAAESRPGRLCTRLRHPLHPRTRLHPLSRPAARSRADAPLGEIHENLLDRLQEAKEQGWLGEVAAIEASLAAAEQKLAAMRDLATRHTTVHLGMPDFRSVVARIDPEQRNEDAKQQS